MSLRGLLSDLVNVVIDKENCPTLALPPLGRHCTLCSRCLTLLSHFITHFGDGSNYTRLRLTHSRFGGTSSCPVCRKANYYFDHCLKVDGPRRRIPKHLWVWRWQTNPYNPSHYKDPPHLNHPELLLSRASLSVEMLAAYGEFDDRIGCFSLSPGVTSGAITPLRVAGLPWHLPALASPDRDRIQQWMFDCVEDHPECCSSNQWYPDRLVYYDETTRCCRLVLKEELTEPYSPYVSFSHCWGVSDRIVLTKANLPLWRQEIPVGQLGQSLQDAIKTTIDAGFLLVWIDSICIIQDSTADWLEQAPMMNEVYKNAAFNIAALDAKSDEEGFLFSNRDPHFEFGFSAPFAAILDRQVGETRVGPSINGSSAQECILLRTSTLEWSYDTSRMPSALSCPLFKRGWVFQERNLARRTLAFQNNGVSWSCDRGTQSERDTRDFIRSTTMQKYRSQLASGGQRMSFGHLWEEVVRDYTKCQLTRQTDRLIAIGALAKEVSGPYGRYLAGLWAVDIWSQLYWRCQGWGFEGHATRTPPRAHLGDDKYVAPSWSWASVSVPCKMRFHIKGDDKHGHAIRICLQTSGSDYGQIKAGWLRLWGCLNTTSSLHQIAPRRNIKDRHIWDPPGLQLVDERTGETLDVEGDTEESYNIAAEQQKLVRWMPLINNYCLVLLKVDLDGPTGYQQQDGEHLEVYRRIGLTDMTPTLWQYVKTMKDAPASSEDAQGRVVGYQQFILI